MDYSKCCTCYNPDINDLIYTMRFNLDKLSQEVVNKRHYGYSCDSSAFDKSDIIQDYLRIIEDERRRVALGGKPCLDCYLQQSLAEKIRLITKSCNLDQHLDVIIDDSNEDAWIARNPYCVSREKWEKIAYTICKAFNIDIQITSDTADCDIDIDVLSVEQACDLSFEIVRNIIPCDIMVAISVYEDMCNLNLSVNRTEQECKLDFDILTKELKCDIDFDTYAKLIDCNLSFDIISTIYSNGCAIEIDENNNINLITSLNSYPLTSLGSGIPDVEALKSLGVDLSDSQYVVNPEIFTKKLKTDYSG